MSKSYEEISKANVTSNGKTDSNLSNDSNHLGGIPADQYVTNVYMQNYYKTKETIINKTIKEGDEKVLEEAKEYTNSIIRNQDFSKFAKLTDLSALDEKLLEKIDKGLQEQKKYTDTKTQTIVDDTNANFEDINTAIEELNNNMNEVFQSVSSGKTKVAEAITDKGVTTSADASFETMASNIKKITTGGSIPEGYIDTSDASATASDILLGKSAYANGQKIYGTNTGIVDISQITPTYGTDTSGTTATASDILVGKTAYSNGQLLTGTLDYEVEEIYGLVEEEYTRTEVSGYTNVILSDTEEIILTSTGIFGISQCGNFIVSEVIVTQGETETRYIQSKRMNDEEIYASATSDGENTIKRKSLWSFEELGLDSSASIDYISFGNPGFHGSQNIVALCIIQGTKAHFYPYEIGTLANGYIGYSYNTDMINHYSVELEMTPTCAATPANLNSNIFGIFVKSGLYGYFYTIRIYDYLESIVKTSCGNYVDLPTGSGKHGLKTCKFSPNDTYLYGTQEDFYWDILYKSPGYSAIVRVNTNTYNITLENALKVNGACCVLPNEAEALVDGYLCDLTYDEALLKLTLTKKNETRFVSKHYRYNGFSPDLQYYYGAYYKTKAEGSYVGLLNIYKVDFNATGEWEFAEQIGIPAQETRDDNFRFAPDMSFGTTGNANLLVRVRKNIDTENIVGVKYKNKYFYTGLGGTEE